MPTKALVVDDSMLVRYTVCRYLEERGFTVESATNGVEALEVLSRMHADLIFTDMRMPKMSGSEFITELKRKPETAKVPIIIVAARASGFEETETRADFVIYKDIEIDSQLDKVVEKLSANGFRAQAAGR